MKSALQRVAFALFVLRILPLWAVYRLSRSKGNVDADLGRWIEVYQGGDPSISRNSAFLRFMQGTPEFRNLFYHRVGSASRPFRFLCPPCPSLYLQAPIGPGLFLQHAFATIVVAESVGANCWINQQVTIGVNANGKPTIGDNVTVCAGAKVLGPIKVGEGSIIGANAVVVKDVPPRCTVVGAPAFIVRRDGVRVNEKL